MIVINRCTPTEASRIKGTPIDCEPLAISLVCLEEAISTFNQGYVILLNLCEMPNIRTVHGREIEGRFFGLVCNYVNKLNPVIAAIYRVEQDRLALFLREHDRGAAEALAELVFARFGRNWMLPNDAGKIIIRSAAHVCVMPAGSYNCRAADYMLDLSGKLDKAVFYDEDAHKLFCRRLIVEAELNNSVRNDMRGFTVEYQPVVETSIGTWGGLEALCRWHCPGIGTVSPGEFIPVAEACGHIIAIDHWVLEQSVAQVKAWNLDRFERFMLYINISRFQLITDDIVDVADSVLAAHDFPPEKLCVEFTRANSSYYPNQDMRTIELLNQLGICTALDDFGDDYISINYLHKQPVGVVKIHSSFISAIETDRHMQHLIHYMVSLAHESGKKVVAKGVENDSQVLTLLKQGIDYLQGYYFSRVMPPEKIENELVNFYLPQKAMLSRLYAKPDLLKRSGQDAFELSPSHSKLLNQCMFDLFFNPDGDAAILSALENIARGLNVSRAYVFQLDESGEAFSATHEWCAEGIAPMNDGLKQMPLVETHKDLIAALTHNGAVIMSDTHDPLYHVMESLSACGTRSAAMFSIFKNGALHGFVGFDDCGGVRVWTRGELQMLHIITEITTSAITRIEQEKALEVVAATDTLTNILNRSALIRALKRLLSKADKTGSVVTLAFIDIDSLKHVNDTYGHLSGDELIISVVDGLRGCIRKTDLIGRYGGDEFIMAFPDSPKVFTDERLRLFLKSLCEMPGSRWIPSFSYGLVESSEFSRDSFVSDDEYIETLIDTADKRMFLDKRQRKR